MAIVLAIFLLPVRGLFWVVRHPKILILIVIAVFAFVGIRACNSVFGGNSSTPQIAKYQEIAPTKEKAPYVLATSTRIYYVVKYSDDKQVITLQEYYIYDKKKWKLQTTPLPIDRKYYGEVRFYERKD